MLNLKEKVNYSDNYSKIYNDSKHLDLQGPSKYINREVQQTILEYNMQKFKHCTNKEKDLKFYTYY